MKVRKIIKLIEKAGWFFAAQKGSHRQFKHPTIKGRVTIPGNLNDELPAGTFIVHQESNQEMIEVKAQS